MPFWRRRRDEPPVPEVDEPVDPALVDPDWEPDPADFDDLDDGTPRRADPGHRPAACRSRQSPPIGHDHPAPGAGPGRPPTTRARRGREPVHEPRRRPRRPRSRSASSGRAAASCPVCAASSGRGPAKGRRGTTSRRRSSPATSGPRWPSISSSAPASDATRAVPEAAIRAELAALLVPRDLDWSPRSAVAGGPAVVLVVGVNGTGKTTTIGKLASRYAGEGRSVILAAADTFRAAAIDQLRIWADRAARPDDRPCPRRRSGRGRLRRARRGGRAWRGPGHRRHGRPPPHQAPT